MVELGPPNSRGCESDVGIVESRVCCAIAVRVTAKEHVHMKTKFALGIAAIVAGVAFATALKAARPQPALTGHYMEVRSCDIYTGSCVANSEMGLSGREGMLVWTVQQGQWKGATLDGLTVMAVLRTDDTLGDMRYEPRNGEAVLIVDNRANRYQHEALVDLAKSAAGSLVKSIAAVRSEPIETAIGTCASGSCAKVKAGSVVEISTRCLGGKDHLCGNEENFYPPLTAVHHPLSVYTELAVYQGSDLNVTWELTGKRSAYVAEFTR